MLSPEAYQLILAILALLALKGVLCILLGKKNWENVDSTSQVLE